MPQARRQNNRLSDEDRAAIRQETLAEVRSALNSADDYEEFKDAMYDDPAPELSFAEVAAMDEEAINANWKSVSETLARGPGGDVPLPPPADQQLPPPRRPTGMQIAGHVADVGGLDLAAIKRMSTDEVNARWPEVQAALARGR